MNNEETKIQQIAEHVGSILNILEVDLDSSTQGTAKRVAKMYVKEVFSNINNNNIEELNKSMKTFPKEYNGEMILLKDIPFYSMCEHHLMPFSGKITVGYVPNNRIVGLSKIPRAVKFFSKKPQLQEKLVEEIAEYLYSYLNCEVVYVLATNTIHTCVTARGIETYCDTDTMACKHFCDMDREKEYRKEFYTRVKR